MKGPVMQNPVMGEIGEPKREWLVPEPLPVQVPQPAIPPVREPVKV